MSGWADEHQCTISTIEFQEEASPKAVAGTSAAWCRLHRIDMKATEQQEPPQEKQSSTQLAPEPKSTDEKEHTPLARLKLRVLQPIQKKIYLPLNRFLDKLGYVSSALLLLGIAGVSALGIRVWNNPDEGARAITVVRFYLEARKPVPPRDPGMADVVRDLTNLLKDDVSPANRNRDYRFGDWTEAQMVVSLQERDAFESAEMAQWFNNESGECHCWRASPKDREHLAATAWVLIAFARMRVKPTEQEIEFILNNQHRPGWWPIFYPATDHPGNASTFATSLCTWALAELLHRDLVPASHKQHVTEAIRKGENWLLDNTLPGKPGRWKDYPNGEYGQESLGVSGLALHALHRSMAITATTPLAHDVDWMTSLPAELPAPKAGLSSGEAVILTSGSAGDPTHYFDLPWLIIGTADAYREGSLSQRAQAARLIHKISGERETIIRELKDMPWLAAETLIALRYLQGEDVI